jgi:hypothetical protein
VPIDDALSIDVAFVFVRSLVGTMLEVPRCASNYIREELTGNERLKVLNCYGCELRPLLGRRATARSVCAFTPSFR